MNHHGMPELKGGAILLLCPPSSPFSRPTCCSPYQASHLFLDNDIDRQIKLKVVVVEL